MSRLICNLQLDHSTISWLLLYTLIYIRYLVLNIERWRSWTGNDHWRLFLLLSMWPHVSCRFSHAFMFLSLLTLLFPNTFPFHACYRSACSICPASGACKILVSRCPSTSLINKFVVMFNSDFYSTWLLTKHIIKIATGNMWFFHRQVQTAKK